MSGIKHAIKDLTCHFSQEVVETGPTADALDWLGFSANNLIAPLDQCVAAINAVIETLVPAVGAAVAELLFGEEGAIAMSRIGTATLRQATEDVLGFGVVISEQESDQIERTTDAISGLAPRSRLDDAGAQQLKKSRLSSFNVPPIRVGGDVAEWSKAHPC